MLQHQVLAIIYKRTVLLRTFFQLKHFNFRSVCAPKLIVLETPGKRSLFKKAAVTKIPAVHHLFCAFCCIFCIPAPFPDFRSTFTLSETKADVNVKFDMILTKLKLLPLTKLFCKEINIFLSVDCNGQKFIFILFLCQLSPSVCYMYQIKSDAYLIKYFLGVQLFHE